MLSGTLSIDFFGETLRTLSRKQRNGILSLTAEGKVVKILFQGGKILGVEDVDQSPTLAVCRRLADAGMLKEKVVKLVASSQVSVPQLLSLLVEKDYVTREEFVRTKRSYELDLLHSLAEITEGSMEFVPKLIQVDRGLALSLYPGQFLLDMVELENDQPRFNSIFEGIEAESILIQAREGNQRRLTEEEEIVIRTLSESRSPKTVFSKCLLSQYHIVEALLSLHDQDFLRVIPAEGLDENVGLDIGDQQNSLHIPAQSGVTREKRNDGNQSQVVENLVDSATHLLREVSEESEGRDTVCVKDEEVEVNNLPGNAASLTHQDQCSAVSAVLASVGEPLAVDQDAITDDQEVPYSQNENIDTASVDATQSLPSHGFAGPGDLRKRFSSLNTYLLGAEIVDKVTVAILLLYLLAFALLGPALLENWFEALSSFSLY